MATMRAMVLDRPRTSLVLRERPLPRPGPGELLIAVSACGVCRTDLHVVDGELEHPKLPIVPGHEIVGRVTAVGEGVGGFTAGERVGVPWLGATCGVCPYCREGAENLCDAPIFTGYTRDGGFATHTVADARFCFPLGEGGDDAEIAPWLCAGLIGWRSLRLAGAGKRLGLYGFGAAAHILAQVARWQGRSIYAFTRAGDTQPTTVAPKIRTRERDGVQITTVRTFAALLADRIDAITDDARRLHTLEALLGASIAIRSEADMTDEQGTDQFTTYREYGRLSTSYEGTADLPVETVLDLAARIRAAL